MNELEKLSRFIVDLNLDKISKNVTETAKLCVLDSFAVAVGASKDELVEGIISEYKALYPNSYGNNVFVWGHNLKLPVIQAIFLNSLMGHRLELDDVHTNSKTHIGTVVVPTAICLAQYLNSSGKDFLEAVICGYETMSRIGMGFGVSSHRNKGWHVTSTAGTFGAAATAAKLLKLNQKETTSALGMAGTQSFGLWAFLEDSASSKILHPARAASNGTEAAFLAKAGMIGPRSILDAKDGSLFRAMSEEYDLSLITKGLGLEYEILKVDNKPYPCCRSTHCAIDSALYFRSNYNIDINQIMNIDIETYLVGFKQCGLADSSKNPITPIEARFSTPYTFAAALIDGQISLEHFRVERIREHEVQTLLKKINVKPSDVFTDKYPEHWGCRAKIHMLGDKKYEVVITDALGSVYNPVSFKEIVYKATPMLKNAYIENDIINNILNIDNLHSLSFECFMV